MYNHILQPIAQQQNLLVIIFKENQTHIVRLHQQCSKRAAQDSNFLPLQKNKFQSYRIRRASMAAKPPTTEKTVYVEYCRSCETHNWCTHHDQSKYHDTFLKLCDLIAKRLPDLQVIGNMVPSNLIPFKIAENKYIDSNTNKYVVYPQIGSFQVRINNNTIFSKKDTNSWPNLNFIINRIAALVDPNYQSPNKVQKTSKSPPKEMDNTPTEKAHPQESFTKMNDEKTTHYKDQTKGFTLTDHFKLYRPKNKFQDKDWLTEKQQSQASSKQLSQLGRGESRQKSDKSEQTKSRLRDFNGETKLKEMLKNRGLMVKEQGKKEMIIKLDSIQEENAYYEEGNGATQRTQQKNTKKHRMQELQDQFSSLENKFKNFQNKVNDIHTKNKQFEYKNQNADQKSRVKQKNQSAQQRSRVKQTVQSIKKEDLQNKTAKNQQLAISQKEKMFFLERASKLDQYLNYSQQQKNQKLHRIYGEWKILNQTSQKNKRILKNKKREQQQGESSQEQTSQAHSQSPSFIGNAITFKPKIDKSMQKLISKAVANQKSHKYSNAEKYNTSNNQIAEPQFRTEENFYNKNKLQKLKADNNQSEKILHPATKLFKKGISSMSTEGLKHINAYKQLAPQQKRPLQPQQAHFSPSAKQNIKQIQERISNIQQQLKINKDRQQYLNSGQQPKLDIDTVYKPRTKSRSQSGASNYSSKNNKNKKQNSKGKVSQPRNSHRTVNSSTKKYVKNNTENHRFSNFSQVTEDKYARKTGNQSSAIEQESQVHQSNPQTHRSKQNDQSDGPTSQNRTLDNHHQSTKIGRTNQPQKKFRQKLIPKQDQRLLKQANNLPLQQKQEHKTSRVQHTPDKESKAHQYALHDPVTFLKKKKQWRQSSPPNKSPTNARHRSSQLQSDEQPKKILHQKSAFSNKIKLSDSKQTISRPKKQLEAIKRQNKKTLKKQNSKTQQNQKEKNMQVAGRSTFGRIRKNISKQYQDYNQNQQQQHLLRVSNDQSQQQQQQQDIQNENQAQQFDPEYQSNPVTPIPDENESSLSQSNYLHKHSLRNQSEKLSRPSGKIVQNSNKKQLGYYKSGQICYQGQGYINKDGILYSDLNPSSNPDEIDNSRKQINQRYQTQINKSSKSFDNEKMSGWKLNSQQQQNDQILMDQESQSEDEQEEQIENQRKNSLDAQLQNRDEDFQQNHQQIDQVKQQKDQHYPYQSQNNNFVQKQLTQQDNNQQQPNISNTPACANAECPQGNYQNTASTLKNTTKATPNQEGQQPITGLANVQQPMKQSAKTNKVKKPKQKKMQQKSTIIYKPKPEVDLQKMVSQQYSAYLLLKISSELSKQPQKINQNEEGGQKSNAITCLQRQQGVHHYQVIPTNFMEFHPEASVQEADAQKQILLQEGQMQSDYEEDEEDDQQQDLVEGGESIQLSSRPLDQQDLIIQQVACYINKICLSIVDQICPSNTEQNYQQIPQKKIKQQVVLLNAPTHIQTNILQDKLAQETSPQQSSNSKINKVQSVYAPQHQANSAITRSVSTLQNNVYSQPKQASYFKEIGVQKQLTNQVSVQTDHPQEDNNAEVIIVGNTIINEKSFRPNTTSRPNTTGRNSPKIKLLETNPIKDNYLTQTKDNTFVKKLPLKQIQRAHILQKIYSRSLNSQAEKFSNLIAGHQQDLVKEQGPVLKLQQVYPNGCLISDKGLSLEHIQTRFTKLLKVVQILCEKSQWLITRLFQDCHGVLKDKAFAVWLCRQYQWQCILLDDNIAVDQENHPFYSVHQGNQMWFNVLQKAVAVAIGGYEQLLKAETNQLFTLLTGCNAISIKLKQDPSKNGKLLQLINDCLRKNFIIHAQKTDKHKLQLTKENTYYINSVRRSVGEQETLIEISQDARESFWIKLSKFVQQFSKIQILQLRINHNFAHLDLGIGRPGQLTVVELDFQQDGQGCVTLTYLGQSGALRAFLYREQKNKVLKLVGQAKQKSKSHLFFQCSFLEGKYFVFAQAEERPARLAFQGEGTPTLRITEQIHSEGLKNEMAEYLPVKQSDENKYKRSDYDSDWRGGSRAPRLKDNFVESRLRENFVDYVVGRSKRVG